MGALIEPCLAALQMAAERAELSALQQVIAANILAAETYAAAMQYIDEVEEVNGVRYDE